MLGFCRQAVPYSGLRVKRLEFRDQGLGRLGRPAGLFEISFVGLKRSAYLRSECCSTALKGQAGLD